MKVNKILLIFIFFIAPAVNAESLSLNDAKMYGIKFIVEDLPVEYEGTCKQVSMTLPKTIKGYSSLNKVLIEINILNTETNELFLSSYFNVYFNPRLNKHEGYACLPLNNNKQKINLSINYQDSFYVSSGITLHIENFNLWRQK